MSIKDVHFFAIYVTSDFLDIPTYPKFPEKIMVWIIISYRGCAEIFSQKTLDNKEGLPCYKPGLPTVYGKDTLAEMAALDLKYITKDLNPPNAPKFCPIKNYWSVLKQKVYANNWSAKNPEATYPKKSNYVLKRLSHLFIKTCLLINLKSKICLAVKDVVESVASVA